MYSIPLPLAIGGKGSPLRGLGRASHYHSWEPHSIAFWLVGHLIAIGGKGTPLPFDGKGIPVAFQKGTAGGCNQDIRTIS